MNWWVVVNVWGVPGWNGRAWLNCVVDVEYDGWMDGWGFLDLDGWSTVAPGRDWPGIFLSWFYFLSGRDCRWRQISRFTVADLDGWYGWILILFSLDLAGWELNWIELGFLLGVLSELAGYWLIGRKWVLNSENARMVDSEGKGGWIAWQIVFEEILEERYVRYMTRQKYFW